MIGLRLCEVAKLPRRIITLDFGRDENDDALPGVLCSLGRYHNTPEEHNVVEWA